MADPERDPESERRTDPRYDNWPTEEYDEWTNWPVERATPRDEDGTLDELAEETDAEPDYQWVGMSGTGAGTAYVYDGTSIYEADIDREDERVRLRGAARTDDDSRSLGEHIEEIGEEHGWSWLSSFAREHLKDDERPVRATGGIELRDSEFGRRGVAESAAYDLSFTGRHTFADESGQVHILDRQFDVYTDDDRARAGHALVEIGEDRLVAEKPNEEVSRGDADIVEERTTTFEIEVDTDHRAWENELETTLKEWHLSHIGELPAGD